MTGNLPSGRLSPLGRRSQIMFVLIARHALINCSTPVRAQWPRRSRFSSTSTALGENAQM
ncbi:hypothetical protein [Streptosporangium sp. NPDC049046]|uniref:hypothetical protein n=1 Tax=Streptosporangium sp. NPDC049046 TaxID=3155031 RepID=UPI003437A79D